MLFCTGPQSQNPSIIPLFHVIHIDIVRGYASVHCLLLFCIHIHNHVHADWYKEPVSTLASDARSAFIISCTDLIHTSRVHAQRAITAHTISHYVYDALLYGSPLTPSFMVSKLYSSSRSNVCGFDNHFLT